MLSAKHFANKVMVPLGVVLRDYITLFPGMFLSENGCISSGLPLPKKLLIFSVPICWGKGRFFPHLLLCILPLPLPSSYSQPWGKVILLSILVAPDSHGCSLCCLSFLCCPLEACSAEYFSCILYKLQEIEMTSLKANMKVVVVGGGRENCH